MNNAELASKCRELDAVCKKFHPLVMCRVSNPLREYLEILGEASQDADELDMETLFAYVTIPGEALENGISIKEVADRLQQFSYVSRVLLEFCDGR